MFGEMRYSGAKLEPEKNNEREKTTEKMNWNHYYFFLSD